jgi:putative transposase
VSLPSARVTRALEQVIEWRGNPKVVRSDNGPGYIGHEFQVWAEQRGITLAHINRASLPRTLTSNASTALCAMNG